MPKTAVNALAKNLSCCSPSLGRNFSHPLVASRTTVTIKATVRRLLITAMTKAFSQPNFTAAAKKMGKSPSQGENANATNRPAKVTT